MPLTAKHRKNFTYWFIAIFYLLAMAKWLQGQWLFQVDPFMFTARFDGTTWLLMITGFHLWALKFAWVNYMWDVLFYGFPVIYAFVFLRNNQLAAKLSWIWLVINWLYVQVYTLYPTNSIEGHTAWLFFPLLFATQSLRSFYLVMHGLRYFFLFFFFSAGVWKLAQGGAFDPVQMSAILMEQHKDFLISSPGYWQSKLIYFLIEMPLISFSLYWIGILVELSFIVGFFTRRYDRLLIALFMLFLLFDYLVMRIPYFEVLPYLLTLLYSHFGLPENEVNVSLPSIGEPEVDR
jgi:hypothetical protein